MFNRVEQRLFRVAAIYAWIACVLIPLMDAVFHLNHRNTGQLVAAYAVGVAVEGLVGFWMWAVPWHRLKGVWVFLFTSVPVNLLIAAAVWRSGDLNSSLLPLYIFNIVFVFALLGFVFGTLLTALTLITQCLVEWLYGQPLFIFSSHAMMTLFVAVGLGHMVSLVTSIFQTHVRQIESLNRMSLSLSQLDKPEEVIQRAVAACVQETKLDFGLLCTLDRLGNHAKIVFASGHVPEELLLHCENDAIDLKRTDCMLAESLRLSLTEREANSLVRRTLSIVENGRTVKIKLFRSVPIQHGDLQSVLILGTIKRYRRSVRDQKALMKAFQPYLSTALLYAEQLRQTGAALNDSETKYLTANEKLQQSYLRMVRTLIETLEAKDRYTRGHSERVSEFATAIALELGLNRSEVETIELAALLHDVGKIGVPDSVLLKAGKLTEEEWEMMQKHPVLGSEILQYLDYFEPFLPGVRSHHERMDGKGYPDQLNENSIPLMARIIAVADAFDALTSHRAYRSARTFEEAADILRGGRGTQWDEDCVDAFLRYLDKIPR